MYFILTFFSIIALNLGNFGYVIIKLWILVENLNPQNARNIQIYNLLVKVKRYFLKSCESCEKVLQG